MLIIEILEPIKNSPSELSASVIFSYVKDSILAATAITGAIIAFRGVNTWRRQLNGQADHNLCKNLLVSIFKYRDAIRFVRNPFMSGSEQPSPPSEKINTMTEQEKRYYGISKAYAARWDKVIEAHAQVYAYLIETEALWGNEVKLMWEEIRKLESELLTALEHIIEAYDPNIPTHIKESSPDEIIKNRRTVYESYRTDTFRPALEGEITKIENYVRKKLRG